MRERVLGSLEWLGVLLPLLLAAECTINAAEKTAAELFPPTTVGYLEVPQPGKLVSVVLDHPLTQEIANQPGYQKALAGREYEQIQAVLKVAAEKLGMNGRQAVASLTDGGLSIGFDLPTQGFAALAKATDESLQRSRLATRCSSWPSQMPRRRINLTQFRKTMFAASPFISLATCTLPYLASGYWRQTSGCFSRWCSKTIWEMALLSAATNSSKLCERTAPNIRRPGSMSICV